MRGIFLTHPLGRIGRSIVYRQWTSSRRIIGLRHTTDNFDCRWNHKWNHWQDCHRLRSDML